MTPVTGCVKHGTILAEEPEQDLGTWESGGFVLDINADIRYNEKFI